MLFTLGAIFDFCRISAKNISTLKMVTVKENIINSFSVK
jgi:hypothetical protein